MTLVSVAADSRIVGARGSGAGRRLMSVSVLMIGAIIGSLLILHAALIFVLVLAISFTAAISIAARVLSRTSPDWVQPAGQVGE